MFIYGIVDIIFVGNFVGVVVIGVIMVVLFIIFLIFSVGMVIGIGGSFIVLWVFGCDDIEYVF